MLDDDRVTAQRQQLADAVAGRYRVIRLLGAGAMGEVYLAWELNLERYVAIKLLAPGLNESIEDRERFRREARVLAGLNHPHIVPVYSFERSADLTFVVMRYVPGESLAARLEREHRLSARATVALLAPLADAIDAVHRRGVVHRDIKPDNILLDESAGGGPVLADFGVAMVRTSEYSRADAKHASGTPHFMSPEHVLGAPDCDGRSDIYALGVVGFRMLAGRLPFTGSAEGVAARHIALAAPPLRDLAPDVPQPLADVIARCLAKDPRERWESGAKLRDALLASLAGRRSLVLRVMALLGA
jgi:serine/threonine-protein kinase